MRPQAQWLMGAGNASSGIFSLGDLFSAGQDGFAIESDNLSTLWQDASGGTAVTGAGDPIGQIDDVSGNGYVITAAGAARPVYQELAGTAWAGFSGSQYFEIAGSDSSLAWMHKDGGIGIAILAQLGETADPNTVYGLFGNAAGSSETGIRFYLDDRASSGNNEKGTFQVSKGVGGSSVYVGVTANGAIPVNKPDAIRINIPPGGPAVVTMDAATVATATKLNSASTGNASRLFRIGEFGDGTFRLVGRVYQMVVRDPEFSSSEISAINSYFSSKL